MDGFALLDSRGPRRMGSERGNLRLHSGSVYTQTFLARTDIYIHTYYRSIQHWIDGNNRTVDTREMLHHNATSLPNSSDLHHHHAPGKKASERTEKSTTSK